MPQIANTRQQTHGQKSHNHCTKTKMRKAIQPHVLGAGERGPRGRDTVPVHCGPSVSLATHDQPSNLTARNTDGETGCKVNDAPHERACSTLLTTQNEDQPGWPTTGECLSTPRYVDRGACTHCFRSRGRGLRRHKHRARCRRGQHPGLPC